MFVYYSRSKPRYHEDVTNQGFRDDYGYETVPGGGFGDSYERYHRSMAPEINRPNRYPRGIPLENIRSDAFHRGVVPEPIYRSRSVKPAYY